MFRKPIKVTAIEVDGRQYAVHYFEQKTIRGSCRFSCEVLIDATDRVIVDDDSMSSLESKMERLAAATVYSRVLAGRGPVAA